MALIALSLCPLLLSFLSIGSAGDNLGALDRMRYSDRLTTLLKASHEPTVRAAEPASSPGHTKSALSPRDLFGLDARFTLRQLNAARRRLLYQVHPDRFVGADSGRLATQEELTKIINVAYDTLRGETA